MKPAAIISLGLLCVFSWVVSAVAAPPVINADGMRVGTVAAYGKLELRVPLDASYDNPYDPSQVELSAEFTAPSGRKWRIPGFFNPSGRTALWMVRFTPDEPGHWSYVLTARDSQGTATADPGSFEVTASDSHGFLRVADNGRYLQYTDGAPFYGVGMWYNDGYDGSATGGSITEAGLDRLKGRGCNFIGFYPTPLETLGTGLGRYDQDRCARLDRLFEWCEQRGLKISWNLLFHSYASETVWGGGNVRWQTTPYRDICSAKDLFTSPEAWRYQKNLLRYIVARWGYSPSLFLWFVIDEINGTDAWVHGDTAAAEAWCVKVRDWLHANDPWHRPTAGTQSGGLGQYWPNGYRIFDIASREIYEAQHWPMPKAARVSSREELPLRASYLNYGGETARLWKEFSKPAIIGECGWAHTYFEPSQPGYLAMYHNAIWAGLVNGLCATPFWWAYSDMIDQNVVNLQLEAFSRFVGQLDFTGSSPAPLACKPDKGVDAWAMRNGDTVFGWAVSPRLGEGIAGARVKVSGLADGSYLVRVYHAWRGRFMGESTVASSGGSLTITAPELTRDRDRANNLGDDFAFVITPAK